MIPLIKTKNKSTYLSRQPRRSTYTSYSTTQTSNVQTLKRSNALNIFDFCARRKARRQAKRKIFDPMTMLCYDVALYAPTQTAL